LFIQDGLDLQLFGLLGDDNTYGDQAILNGLRGPVSFSLSQFMAHTDGYRPNNDDTQRQYDAFVQGEFGASTSAQVEVSRSERESGDLQNVFFPTLINEALRNDTDVDTQRFGLRQVINASSDVLVSIIRQERDASAELDDPDFPLTIVSNQESWKAEAQYLTKGGGIAAIVGASYFDGETYDALISPFFVDEARFTPRHVNAHAYFSFATRAPWPRVQLGVAYDDLTSDVGEQSELNPKIGVIWKPADFVTLRAAAFRVLKRRINADQGLEPTQLAGFNQFFDDQNGTVSESGGLAADFELHPRLWSGLHVMRRDLKVPFFNTPTEVFFDEQRVDSVGGYVYWLPNQRLTLSLQPEYQDFDHGAAFDTMRLTEIPLDIRFFFPVGLWMGASVTRVEQKGQFDGPGGVVAEGSDSFWLLDASLAYRLPRRRGTISLQGTNLLSEDFRFQEIDLNVAPRYIPETQVVLRVSISL
jgi:hypothetical protein